KPCFNRTIGLCPGVCTGEMDQKEYTKRIKELKMFFQGKKMSIIKDLEKTMHDYAKKHMFEKANEVKKTLYSLSHIKDVSMIKNIPDQISNSDEKGHLDNSNDGKEFRIEAYDVAHLSGKSVVGAMVVMVDSELE